MHSRLDGDRGMPPCPAQMVGRSKETRPISAFLTDLSSFLLNQKCVLTNIVVPVNPICPCLVSPGGRKISVSPKPNTIIKVSRVAEEADCSVCTFQGSSQVCKPKQLTLANAANVSLEFTCPQPQDVFAVEINRKIGGTITDIRRMNVSNSFD